MLRDWILASFASVMTDQLNLEIALDHFPKIYHIAKDHRSLQQKN